MLQLRSKVTRKILDYYFFNPTASHYVNELAGFLDLDPKNTHRKLEELEAAGLLQSVFNGKQRYFSINKKSPLLKEYKTILFHTAGWQQQLSQDLQSLVGLKQALIFGSAASGKMDEKSDIDLLLVGSHSVLMATKIIAKLQKSIGREVNVVQMSSQEFTAKKKNKNEFVTHILKNKIIKLV